MNKNKFYNEELPFVNSPNLNWQSYPEFNQDLINDTEDNFVFANDGRGNVPNHDKTREDQQKQKTYSPQEQERTDKQRIDRAKDGKRQAA